MTKTTNYFYENCFHTLYEPKQSTWYMKSSLAIFA